MLEFTMPTIAAKEEAAEAAGAELVAAFDKATATPDAKVSEVMEKSLQGLYEKLKPRFLSEADKGYCDDVVLSGYLNESVKSFVRGFFGERGYGVSFEFDSVKHRVVVDWVNPGSEAHERWKEGYSRRREERDQTSNAESDAAAAAAAATDATEPETKELTLAQELAAVAEKARTADKLDAFLKVITPTFLKLADIAGFCCTVQVGHEHGLIGVPFSQITAYFEDAGYQAVANRLDNSIAVSWDEPGTEAYERYTAAVQRQAAASDQKAAASGSGDQTSNSGSGAAEDLERFELAYKHVFLPLMKQSSESGDSEKTFKCSFIELFLPGMAPETLIGFFQCKGFRSFLSGWPGDYRALTVTLGSLFEEERRLHFVKQLAEGYFKCVVLPLLQEKAARGWQSRIIYLGSELVAVLQIESDWSVFNEALREVGEAHGFKMEVEKGLKPDSLPCEWIVRWP